MNEPVSVVGRIGGDADTATHIVCYFQFAFPKIVIDRFLMERQYAHSNTSDLEMSFGNKFFFGGVYFYNFTFIGLSVKTGDSTGKNPGVESLKRIFFTGF